MQTYVILAVYDKAISSYMRPFMAQTSIQGLREFSDEVLRPDSQIGKHPEDYALFKVGEFDDTSGEVIANEPTCLARAHEIPKIQTD